MMQPTNNAKDLFKNEPPSEKGQNGEHEFLARMVEKAQASPLKIISFDDATDVVAKVCHVLNPGEKLGEFYSRTGLGKSQAMLMSRDEITAFVIRATENAREQESSSIFQPKPIPSKFIMA
jgi:hypothetical protein